MFNGKIKLFLASPLQVYIYLTKLANPLLLLDYNISDMSGDIIARKINEYSRTKIILISAYNLDGSLLKELNESDCIAKFIKKPINLSSLIETVADTID